MKRLKVLLVFSLCAGLALGSFGCDRNTAGSGPVTPKLVVVIVVDQFRYDYVERFRDVFGPDGFRRLMDKGALFTNANYIYIPTFTAPGHAAIFTGSVPALNGIVGNNWFDRNAADGTSPNKVMVADDTAKLVTSWGQQTNTKATKPASPRIMIGTTFGDQMRLATGFKSKVVAISFKDRAAVLPGGKEANGAFWFDASSGTMVSTDYYFQDMPKWVNKFNSEDRANKYYDQTWDKALSPEAYSATQAITTDVAGTPLERSFPHVLKTGVAKGSEDYYKAFQYTPFASDYLADFAKAAIEGESLGADKYPDLLAISFSTPDLVGHAYGPDSEEIEDTYIRLDRTLADFLNYLDSKIGLSNVLIAMTGDHGVAPVPPYMAIHNVDAGTLDPAKYIEAARTALSNKYGKDEQCDTDTDPKRDKCWVQTLVNDQLYLNEKMMADKKADPAEAE